MEYFPEGKRNERRRLPSIRWRENIFRCNAECAGIGRHFVDAERGYLLKCQLIETVEVRIDKPSICKRCTVGFLELHIKNVFPLILFMHAEICEAIFLNDDCCAQWD